MTQDRFICCVCLKPVEHEHVDIAWRRELNDNSITYVHWDCVPVNFLHPERAALAGMGELPTPTEQKS